MPPATPTRRIRRELATVRAMILLHCRHRHGPERPARGGSLCAACDELWDYARERVERCRFGDGKPTCAACPVHCFKPSMRESIRAVMRYSGPRMLWRHPLLALLHLADGRRPLPVTTATRSRLEAVSPADEAGA